MNGDWARPEDGRKILTVTQLTRAVRGALEARFSRVWIEGEISNYRPHGSGHHYFTLKDESSQVSCVLFRGQARHLNFRLSDGQRVQAHGDVSVYEARGQYQLIVQWVQPRGIGDLQVRFDALKRKLDAEGLFDPDSKKPLPSFPRTIAVVTSPTGAAIRDVLTVIRRRAPWVRVLVVPVRVQGAEAELEIASAIRGLTDLPAGVPEIDLVIAGRGGGGMEDLWAFNEEAVARAIFDCPFPVISAVGHEIDFTIADFVADVRAPTPSAAAELAVPDGSELSDRLGQMIRRLSGLTDRHLEAHGDRLALIRRTLTAHEPRRVVENAIQKLDHLADRMDGAAAGSLDRRRTILDQANRSLKSGSPDFRLSRMKERTDALSDRLERGLRSRRGEFGERLAGLAGALRTLSPDAVFRRGFSLTFDSEGRPVTDAGRLSPGDRVRTRLAKGEFDSVVE